MPNRGRRPLPPGVQGGIFEATAHTEEAPPADAPLAARMRPRDLDEFVGQESIVGPGAPLRLMIERDEVPSIILWGPPGSGKTTIASIIALRTDRHFERISAVSAGVADLRNAAKEARERRRLSGRRTILFIDELHRFSRSQQDVILPHVEDGTVSLIGATTENPSFYVVAPLLSRARVFRLELLTPEALAEIVQRAIEDPERGLAGSVQIEDDALAVLVEIAAGDARSALNVLEVAAGLATPVEGGPSTELETGPSTALGTGPRTIERSHIEAAAQQRTLIYDRQGDAHYDTVSAFIKSMRGSDVDASLYWLARMLEAGEDPLFVVRRMVILAAEDVGLADPRALTLAVACQQAVHFLGMPEAALPLAETVVYLARAPKSNSAYAAYKRARDDVERTRNEPVPMHLRNAVTGLMRGMGYGAGYQYAHDFEGHVPPSQTHRPPAAEGNTYYRPGDLGDEARED